MTGEPEGTRATFSLKTKEGYGVLLTVDEGTTQKTLDTFLMTLEALSSKLKEGGWTVKEEGRPAPRSFPPKKEITYVEGEVCPKCGSKLVEVETKKGKLVKCSTSKYDWQTKTASGCDFVRWPPKTY